LSRHATLAGGLLLSVALLALAGCNSRLTGKMRIVLTDLTGSSFSKPRAALYMERGEELHRLRFSRRCRFTGFYESDLRRGEGLPLLLVRGERGSLFVVHSDATYEVEGEPVTGAERSGEDELRIATVALRFEDFKPSSETVGPAAEVPDTARPVSARVYRVTRIRRISRGAGPCGVSIGFRLGRADGGHAGIYAITGSITVSLPENLNTLLIRGEYDISRPAAWTRVDRR
jgi:hypothetical protein